MLRIRVFGGLAIDLDGAPMSGAATHRKPLALLAQLAMAGERGVSREKLAARLWPESSEEAARKVLAQTLYQLRRMLGGEDVVIGTAVIQLDASQIGSDAADFAAALSAGDAERAVALYVGPFLDGFYVNDAPDFERWVDEERARLQGEYGRALELLAARAAERRDWEAEAGWWRRRAALDPLDAGVALRLMRALAAAGDRTAALRHARVYETLVRDELDSAPNEAVLALASQLRDPGTPVPPATALPESLISPPPPSIVAVASAESPSNRLQAAPSPAAGSPRRPVARRAWAVAAALIVVVAVAALSRAASRRSERAPPIAGEPTTLAVVPFRMLTPASEVRFLGVGIPDAIITRLANVRQLRVRPTSAILRYESGALDAPAVGRELTVKYLVTGTVQDAGDRFRVSVQLVRVSDAAPLWGDHYDLPRTDLLTLEDSVARRVATALRIQMSEAERARVYRTYTENAAAYELYLRGRAELAHHTERATRAAADAFESALHLDPADALAHAGLAMASAEMHLRFAPPAEVRVWGERAVSEARRAVQLDPAIAESHQALAAVYRKTDFDWERTIDESHRALELSPSLELPHYFIAAALYHLGLLDLAEQEARAGIEANPGGDQIEPLRTRGVIALLDGRFQESASLLEALDRITDRVLSEPYLAQAYYYMGDHRRAESMLEPLTRSTSAASAARARATLASMLAARGEQQRARALADAAAKDSYLDHHVAYALGATYAQLGDRATAREWLARAAALGFPCARWFERDPLLMPLRTDAEFQKLLQELRLAAERVEARYRRG